MPEFCDDCGGLKGIEEFVICSKVKIVGGDEDGPIIAATFVNPDGPEELKITSGINFQVGEAFFFTLSPAEMDDGPSNGTPYDEENDAKRRKEEEDS